MSEGKGDVGTRPSFSTVNLIQNPNYFFDQEKDMQQNVKTGQVERIVLRLLGFPSTAARVGAVGCQRNTPILINHNLQKDSVSNTKETNKPVQSLHLAKGSRHAEAATPRPSTLASINLSTSIRHRHQTRIYNIHDVPKSPSQ